MIYKSFLSLEGAEAWLQGIADATAVDAPPPYLCECYGTVLLHKTHCKFITSDHRPT